MRVHQASLIAGLATLATMPKAARAAGNDQAELAKKAQNPVAALISIPLQSNWDFGIGPADATRFTLNFQPVIPFSIGSGTNLIARTIVPFISAESPFEGGKDKSGLGDITQSFFFAPGEPVGGWTIAAGPVFLWAAASDVALGGEKWGAGPTAVALRQRHGWTYGALVNHIWSYAGHEDRSDVSASLLQPFVSYVTKTFTTVGVSSESTYDWEAEQWTVPLNASVSQLLKVGRMPVQLGVSGRHYAETPEGGPEWGMRLTVTLLLPK